MDPWKTPNARASGDGRRSSLSHARKELLLCSTYSSYVPSPASLALAGEQATNDESVIVQRVSTGQTSYYHLSLAISSTTASYSWPGFSSCFVCFLLAVTGKGSVNGASQSILPKFKQLFLSFQAHCVLNLELKKKKSHEESCCMMFGALVMKLLGWDSPVSPFECPGSEGQG